MVVADISAQIAVNSRLEMELGNVVIIGEEDTTEISASMLPKIQEIFSHFPSLQEIDLSTKFSIEKILKSTKFADGMKSYWTVDPIDGTKGFIRGDQYCVCIAMIDAETEKPLISALACPNLLLDPGNDGEKGLMMVSVASVGNFTCKIGEEIESLRALPRVPIHSNLSDAVFTGAFVSTHTDPFEIDGIKTSFGNELPVSRMDSQCKYGLLALGRAHVYYRRHSSKDPKARKDWKCDYVEAIWDNAPGYLFVKEAGGQVTDFDGKDLTFPPKSHFIITGGILASMMTPALHQKVVEIVKARNPIDFIK